MRKSLMFAVLALLFSLVLSSSKAYAYAEFSYNSLFDSQDNSGLVAYNTGSTAYTFNSNSPTCGGYGGTNCFEMDGSDGYPYSWEYLFALNHQNTSVGYHYTNNNTEYSLNTGVFTDTWLTIPANKEIVLSARWIDEPSGYSLAPPNGGSDLGDMSLTCVEDGAHYLSWYPNYTAYATWYSPVLVVNASASVRHCQARLKFGMQASPQKVFVDYFKVFTFDGTEVRDPSTLFLNSTAERNAYCGNGSRSFFQSTPSDDGNNCYSSMYWNCWDGDGAWAFNHTSGNGYYVCRDSTGSFGLTVFMNNTAISRRINNYTSSASIDTSFVSGYDMYNWAIAQTRDPYYFILSWIAHCTGMFGGTCVVNTVYTTGILMTKLSLNQMIRYNLGSSNGNPHPDDPFCFNSNCTYTSSHIPSDALIYNGVPQNAVNIPSAVHDPSSATVNITAYSTENFPAGTAWKYYTPAYSSAGLSQMAGASQYYPFFNSPLSFACDADWICDPSTNYEHYATSSCTNINYAYCGDAGCNETTGRCVSPCSGVAHWACHNSDEAWHFTDVCDNDYQVLCDLGCDAGTGKCVGEFNCLSNSECQSHCDGSNLITGGTCDLVQNECTFSGTQACQYGCSDGACNLSPPPAPLFNNGDSSPLGAISTITGAMLGFLNVTGVPLFNIIFWIAVAFIIISIFSLLAYVVKHGFG